MVTEKEQILIFKSVDGLHKDVTLNGETVWLPQVQMADLLGKEKDIFVKLIVNLINKENC